MNPSTPNATRAADNFQFYTDEELIPFNVADYECRAISITQSLIPECTTPEQLLAYIARVSNPSNQDNHDTAGKLLAYCVRNAHWSPFEQVSMTIEIKTSRTIGRQVLRHRSAVFQEFSQRYAAVDDTQPLFYSEARLQDNKNRQSSLHTDDDELHAWWKNAQRQVATFTTRVYQAALQRGIAKEQARSVLAEGLTPSVMYMTGNIRTWMHYTALRQGNGTQLEHQQIARMCRDLMLTHLPSLAVPLTLLDA